MQRRLAHPLTRGLDLDHPATTSLRRQILASKPFLRSLYREWYGLLINALPAGPGAVAELGSGAGFLKSELLPELIQTDMLWQPGVDAACDAARLPFRDGSLRALVLTNVFHHLTQPRRFLAEASRCLRPGGRIVAIEPWLTRWSGWIYRTLHHEPFDPLARDWERSPESAPLSDANGALPWIVLVRDRELREREFHTLALQRLLPLMPVAYLLSGGVGFRSLAPGWSYPICRRLERWLGLERRAAMFVHFVLERTR